MTAKETFPPTTPYKEIYPSPSPSPKSSPSPDLPHGKGKGKGFISQDGGEGKAIRLRRDEVDDFIRNSELDSVRIALSLLRIPRVAEEGGVRYNNARIMRSIRDTIGEATFREVVVEQWHINDADGAPRSQARAFMSRLTAVKNEICGTKGGAA